jgi:6,7-dimethyl-8-ribityllumazine synthase
MSGEGTPEIDIVGVAEGMSVGIVQSLWNREITDALVDGAQRATAEAQAQNTELVCVPGAFELPLAAQALANDHDVVVALGVVIRGGTPHFEYVCDAATSGLLRVALDSGKPVGFGLLTCDTDGQARDRSGLPGSREDKGYEAAAAALATAATFRRRAVRRAP